MQIIKAQFKDTLNAKIIYRQFFLKIHKAFYI